MAQINLSSFIESSDALPRVGRRGLRQSIAQTLARVHEEGAVDVTNENVRDVVVVDSGLFDEMLRQVKASLRASEGMRLAMTAAIAGVTLPGDLMQPLGLEIDEEGLKRFRAMLPANPTHDEAGVALSTAPALSGSPVLFADDEDDLVFGDE
jgi:hypothetical protein